MMAPRYVGLAALVAALAVFAAGASGAPASAAGTPGGTADGRFVGQTADYCGVEGFNVPDRTPFFDFTDACQGHDECYGLSSNYGDRLLCDVQFLIDMRASCEAMWPVSGPWDLSQHRKRQTCNSYAQLYYAGVRVGGLLNLGPA
ncbi:MAG: phospholipase A2 [Dehalococcoidia bacterium]